MKKRTLFILPLFMALSACASTPQETTPPVIQEPVETLDPKSEIDLSLKPDESGQIMVLMYHNLGDEEDVWVRSVENFKKDLQTLYDLGFRPISLSDYVTGHITTEQGKTPVVLTFDDGRKNNYAILDDGSIDPNCVVAILEDFHASHPDFPLEATFFLTGSVPFGQSSLIEQKINHILEVGMDVGNHTVNHPNFSKLTDPVEIQDEIGLQAQYIEGFIHQDYTVNTLALTYGSRPKADELKPLMAQGSAKDIPYTNIVLLNVGSNPGLSPFRLDFDSMSVPRVRASEMDTAGVGLYDYLKQYESYPERRFMSDGNPEIITIPSAKLESLRTDLPYEIYTY